MLYAYRVKVGVSTNKENNKLFVTKDIIRCRVVASNNTSMKLCPWPVSYGTMDAVHVLLKDCFTELDDAKAAADDRAKVLVGRLNEAIAALTAPGKVLDKTEM